MIGELTAWTYWEGPCPEYIKLCIESIRRWCNVRVLDRTGFDELWSEDRDVPIDDLYVAHRADFIRIYLLHHYGGAWIDADCIMPRLDSNPSRFIPHYASLTLLSVGIHTGRFRITSFLQMRKRR